jgi:hypothetical protein
MAAVAAIGVGSDFCGRTLASWMALAIAVVAFVIYWFGVTAVERGARFENNFPEENHG